MDYLHKVINFFDKNLQKHELQKEGIHVWKINSKYSIIFSTKLNKLSIKIDNKVFDLSFDHHSDDLLNLLLHLESSPMFALLSIIRYKGWKVAIHNDYMLNGKNYTFWLFTKGNLCAKGESENDEEALIKVMEEITGFQ